MYFSLLLVGLSKAAAVNPIEPRILNPCLLEGQHQPLIQPKIITAPDEDTLHVNLTIAAGMVGENLPCGIRYQSRLYDGTFPGPTIVTRRGQELRITLDNQLGSERTDVTVVHNFFHTPNTTNLHLHFIHASPGRGSDSSLDNQDNVHLKVPPESKMEYLFPIYPTHASGTGFYHPHYHGSVYFQMYNGLSGAVIVQDEEDEEYQQAPALADMKELVIVMQDLSTGQNHENIMSMSNSKLGNQEYQFWKRGGDHHSDLPLLYENPHNLSTRLLLVNGQYNPKTPLQAGEIQRLRLINAGTADSVHLMFDQIGQDAGCRMWELAKDSIYLKEAREVDSVFLAAGSRYDVAVQCSDGKVGDIVHLVTDHMDERFFMESPVGDGRVFQLGYIWSTVSFNPNHVNNTNQNALALEIIDGEGTEQATIPTTLPAVPNYTQALIDASAVTEEIPDDKIKVLTFSGPATINQQPDEYHAGLLPMEFRDINGQMYTGELIWNQTVGELDEWHLYNFDDPYQDNSSQALFSHHYHSHTNHFLMMDDDPETGGLFFRKGEIRDTLPFYPTKFGEYSRPPIRIRLLPLDFDGVNVVHCHQADHSDQGMVADFGMNYPPVSTSDGADAGATPAESDVGASTTTTTGASGTSTTDDEESATTNGDTAANTNGSTSSSSRNSHSSVPTLLILVASLLLRGVYAVLD